MNDFNVFNVYFGLSLESKTGFDHFFLSPCDFHLESTEECCGLQSWAH